MDEERKEEQFELSVRLEPAKQRAAQLYLTGAYTNKQISQIMGVAPNTISRWLADPDVIKFIEELQDYELKMSRFRLNAMRNKAVDALEDLVENSTLEQVRLASAKEILDRTGLAAEKKSRIDKNVTVEQTHNKKSELEELADLFFESEAIELEDEAIESED